MRLSTVLLLPIVVATAACERTPVGPGDVSAEVAALLGGAAEAAPLTLPALLQSAVREVYTEHGADAARVLVRELRRLHVETYRTESTHEESAGAKARALRNEELRIVTAVFGEAVAGRVLDDVVSEAGELQLAVEQAARSGVPLPRSREWLAQVAELVADGAEARLHGAARATLEVATHAATLNEEIRRELAAASRVHGLDELFAAALDRFGTTAGPDALQSLLRRQVELDNAAAAAVRAGDPQKAHQALESLRFARIQVVLDVLGAEPVGALLAQAAGRADQLGTALRQDRRAGRDVQRLERMSGTARDLLERAEAARAAGDFATALDLAGHAVTLVNAVAQALPTR